MLQKLNERIKGVIAWVVIAIIAITFALFGIDYYMQTRHASEAQVEVNAQPISAQQIERNFRQARQYSSHQKSGESDQTLKKRVIEDLILNQVSLQAARSNGFEVTDAQVDKTILNIPQFQEDGRFSTERYTQLLSNNLFTSGSFREEVKQGTLLSQQRFAFIGSSFVLPSEVEKFVNLFLETRDYDYFQIPLKDFADTNTISEEKIKQFYEKHGKEFVKPEEVSIQYVRLSLEDIKHKTQISEAQVKQYYEENKNSFHAPAQWQVDYILFPTSEKNTPEEREKIKQEAEKSHQDLRMKPELFSKLQEQLSNKSTEEEKKTWIKAGDAEFDDAFTSLTTSSPITNPVESAQGFKIYKLIDYKPARMKSFAEVQPDLKSQLMSELLQTTFAQVVEELNDLSYQTPDTLTPVSEKLKLPILETQSFSRNFRDSNSVLLKNDQVISSAFSHDVLKLGNNSEPIQLEDNSVVVLRVKEHKPSVKQSLAEVKLVIVNKLALKSAIAETQKFMTQFSAQANLQEQEKFLTPYHVKWENIKKASRAYKKVEASINDFAFSLLPNDKCASHLNGDKFLIVCLKAVNKGQLDQLDKERQASLAQQLESSYGMMDYDLYIKQLLSTAKIVRR